uniref:Uncharacterized protein n=1 Tax=viral metagenome TaxID=1070528 RepID=A0A6C0JUY9_9ZZZZ
MDYYSQFPGPSFTEAMSQLCKTDYSNELNQYIEKCIKGEIHEYGGLGSYTGWNVSVKPKMLQKIKHKIELREKAKKMLRKVFYNFQVYGTFLQLYKDIYYKPNGEYMKSIQPVYENIFKS